jgi:hypothetical protein
VTAAPTSKPKSTSKAPSSPTATTKAPTAGATTKAPSSPTATTKAPSSPTATTTAPSSPTASKAPSTAPPALAQSVLQISPTVSVYVPAQVCRPENCPPDLGDCDANTGECVFKNGYQGLASLPKAYATNYCSLGPDGCLGVTYVNTPYVTASRIAANRSMPVCQDMASPRDCVGIVAVPPRMVGNSQEATVNGVPVKNWGLGLTEASGVCYEITGPFGGTIVVAVTDRCGGYCTCEALTAKQECGPCVNKSLKPGCPCVGTVGGLYSQCCGLASYGCPALDNECDWCASQNHPHFDLDLAAFNYVCGSDGSKGSCELPAVKPVKCMDPVQWPPGGSGGGGAASCGAQAFVCGATSPDPVNQPQIPNSSCCCNWGKKPSGLSDFSCV